MARRPTPRLLALGGLLVGLVLLSSLGGLGTAAAPRGTSGSSSALPSSAPTTSSSPRTPSNLPLPDPVSYSALGDSITPAYDANGTAIDLGIQPYYSYAVGWNTSVFSLWKRLERIYGPNSITPHLLAVPGDKASDMIWQAEEAVMNRSGFVTILIGGNDLCRHSGSTPTPTTVDNFSESLNHTFRILRTQLPPSTVVALANVVNVSILWTLFGGNSQAELVWQSTCPALLTSSGRAMMDYMDRAYNHMEQLITKQYNVTDWDLGNFSFSVDDVNHLDYFHPSYIGHQEIASQWWAALPYASMLPRFTSTPALPASLPVATPLSLQVAVQDVVAPDVDVTYKDSGAFFWSTVPLTLSSGLFYNGTFGVTLPFNATSTVGTLELYLSATDLTGYRTALPGDAPISIFQVLVTSPSSGGVGPLTSVAISPASPPDLTPGGTVTLEALTANGSAEPGGVAYDWSLLPSSLGQLIPENEGATALFVGGEAPGNGTVTVTAISGILTMSSTVSVHIVPVPSAQAHPPPSTPPATQEFSTGGTNWGLLIVAAPAGFLAIMALMGLLLRHRYLRSSPPSSPPPAAASTSASAGPEASTGTSSGNDPRA